MEVAAATIKGQREEVDEKEVDLKEGVRKKSTSNRVMGSSQKGLLHRLSRGPGDHFLPKNMGLRVLGLLGLDSSLRYDFTYLLHG